jgi:hypothetical protein
MPAKNVMPRFAAGHLHSGSKSGPVVKSRKQAIAIMLSEKRHEAAGVADSPRRQRKPSRSPR